MHVPDVAFGMRALASADRPVKQNVWSRGHPHVPKHYPEIITTAAADTFSHIALSNI